MDHDRPSLMGPLPAGCSTPPASGGRRRDKLVYRLCRPIQRPWMGKIAMEVEEEVQVVETGRRSLGSTGSLPDQSLSVVESPLSCQWSQFCPLQIDATLCDCSASISACFGLVSQSRAQVEAERLWSDKGNALALLSVRSGLDLLCSAAAWPRGSEVIMSALNIPDVERIFSFHGYNVVPVDLDLDTLSPSLVEIERAITSKTVAIVVAHVYGARVEMGPIIRIARDNGLYVIEDCAEAYDGNHYKGDPGSDAAFFSFGPVKFATAFQGGIVTLRDQNLLQVMRSKQQKWPLQSRSTYLMRALRFTAYVTLQRPVILGAIIWVLKLIGLDHQRFFVLLVRSFWGGAGATERYLQRLRVRPSAPLLTSLARRFRLASGEGNKEGGRLLMRLLGEGGGGGSGGDLSIPGCKASSHTFWLFPILIRGNAALITSELKRCGVDAGTGSSQIGIVRGWEGVRGRKCAEAERLLRQVVYVPVSRRMPESRVRETARVIRAVLGTTSGQGIGTQVR